MTYSYRADILQTPIYCPSLVFTLCCTHCLSWWYYCSVSACRRPFEYRRRICLCTWEFGSVLCVRVWVRACLFVSDHRLLFPVSEHDEEDVIRGLTGRGSDSLLATSCTRPLFPPCFHLTTPMSLSQDERDHNPLFTPKQRYWLILSPPDHDCCPGLSFIKHIQHQIGSLSAVGQRRWSCQQVCGHLYSPCAAINKPILYGPVASVESAATADMLLCSPPRRAHPCIISPCVCHM